jgi:hypothetical protein
VPALQVTLLKGRQLTRNSYSAFEARATNSAGTSLPSVLTAWGVKRLFVLGLGTEYNILHTVLDALNHTNFNFTRVVVLQTGTLVRTDSSCAAACCCLLLLAAACCCLLLLAAACCCLLLPAAAARSGPACCLHPHPRGHTSLAVPRGTSSQGFDGAAASAALASMASAGAVVTTDASPLQVLAQMCS